MKQVDKLQQPYLLFDFDGTIANSLPLIIETYRHLAQKYKLRSVTDEEVLAMRGKSAFEIFKLSGISVFKIIPLLKEGKDLFGQRIAQVEPVEGIVQALDELRQHFRLAIITSNSTENVETFLRLNQLEFFDFVQSDKTVFGKADVIKVILKQYGLSRSETFYIGDEIRDIHAARRCGIRCVSVSWGLNSKESLLHHKPNIIIDQPAQLLPTIRSLQNGISD